MGRLPKTVEQQASMADQLQKQWYDQQDDEPEEVETTGVEEVADSEPPEAEPELAEEKPKDADYWRHRFETIQGKYNAEVKTVAQQVEALQQKLQESDTRASNLEEQLRSAKRQAPVDVAEHFDPTDVESYGEDMLSMVHRHAESIAEKRLEELTKQFETELSTVRESQQQQQQQQQTSHFYQALESAVPEWQAINGDANFHRWLAQPVSVLTPTGKQELSRQALLEQFEQAGNVRDVIQLFNEFKESKKSRSGGQDVEAPRSVSGGEPNTASHKPNDAEIAAFYADYQRNMKRDPEGTLAREKELMRARYG